MSYYKYFKFTATAFTLCLSLSPFVSLGVFLRIYLYMYTSYMYTCMYIHINKYMYVCVYTRT